MSKSVRLSRRHVLAGAVAASVGRPALVRAATKSTLRFIPVIDLAFVDPVFSPAQVSRNHGYMVFDTLYGMNTKLEVSPQMVEGHAIENDGPQWNLRLRDGLRFHDGEPVLARDCVASIKRWAKRDAFGDAVMQSTNELSAADDRTIRFRLKRPFPYLPYALGKPAVPACFMMPERIAAPDPFKVITEVVGSGNSPRISRKRLRAFDAAVVRRVSCVEHKLRRRSSAWIAVKQRDSESLKGGIMKHLTEIEEHLKRARAHVGLMGHVSHGNAIIRKQ